MAERDVGEEALSAALLRLDAERPRARYAPDAFTSAGLETRQPGEGYDWDGRRRGGDPAQPFLVFQVTLAGWGVYEEAGGTPLRVGEGLGFGALVPGANRYRLPVDAPGPWTFFFLILRHGYVVERIAARQRAMGTAVWPVPAGGVLLSRAVTLFAGRFVDRWDEEAALFDFLLALERAAEAAANPATGERERMLAEARRLVESRLSDPLGVAELAREWGMERSRFSHRFKAATGQSPAQFVTRVRLEEAARRLAQTDETLAAIASAAGFADANHLCKVFRRHFRLSPGAYRRQVR